ncbi:MAG: hypothetical protein AAGI23_14365 [Bacteroidota bacterium]
MSNLRIESSADGFNTYNPIDNLPIPIPNTFLKAEMLQEVTNYWIDAQRERIFLIPFWKAEKLLANSNLGKIALKVYNIEDNCRIDAEWVSFNAETTIKPTLTHDTLRLTSHKIASILTSFINTGETESYFVFGADLLRRERPDVRELA